MSNKPYYYNCRLVKVIDGDTIDVDIDLGFEVILSKQRVRLAGIDTPESRTRNLAEKALGLKAKDRLIELCGEKLQLLSLGSGKYGRILGIPHTEEGEDICELLKKEGHAVEYWGGTKKAKVQEDGTWGE
jgi:micrococcal nuclease|tara:strand:+ start:328 stop:717 length:390 start_codon:yes stop_codon:yes gene_type:complete